MSDPVRPTPPAGGDSDPRPAPRRRGVRGSAPVLTVERPASDFVFVDVARTRHHFLHDVFDSLGVEVLRAWIEAERGAEGFDRAGADGLVTALAECEGRTIAIAWSDFRVRAASYGRNNARRFSAFLRHLADRSDRVPLIYVVNSAGLSLMEGRTAFSRVFEMWPELLRYADRRLVLTCAAGTCLGIAPILYGLGHYRVAVGGRTRINLTGPEVIRLFFGEGFDFDQRAAAERCVELHDLVHECVPSVRDALSKFRELLAPSTGDDTRAWPELDARTASLLRSFLDAPPRELVPGWSPRVRLFVGSRGGRAFGLFVNPLARSNNLITVRTLEKYAAGLDLFRAMRLPIVSLLDSPGIDPRFDETDAGLIRQVLAVGERIIRYPHGALGIVAGRCFGGATTLSFPKVFGGSRVIALRGAQFGVMHERIVDQVLKGSARLLAQWREVAAAQHADFRDLLDEGSLDAVVEPAELAREIDRFLHGSGARLRVVRGKARAPAEARR